MVPLPHVPVIYLTCHGRTGARYSHQCVWGKLAPRALKDVFKHGGFHVTLRHLSKRGRPSNITTDFYKHVHDDPNVLQKEMKSGKQWFPFKEVPQDFCDPRMRDHERLARK